MLKVKNIDVFYGKVQALFNVSMEVHPGEIVSVIGSNGAGKSTLLKTIMGINRPVSGSIEFLGKTISNLNVHRIVTEGIVYVPEGREIFANMTVRENLEMGAYSKKYSKSLLEEYITSAYDMFPRLKERSRQTAGTLSGGEQQMLAISRGLMSNPKIIMLDEPSLGLAPVLVDEMFEAIVKINRDRKIPVVLVEQNAYMAMSISKRTYVLEVGYIKESGDSNILMNSSEIKKAYLGG
ncbi:leucine/isoleucine/valine transporter subunit; ATP-binding component of ABC superfamily [Tepidanaerobacter acetatoxydans Re1]|uniref:Leucine/isoleucine/valine transporter subunit ATP-binding component of ABC superfamily n=1 Tax=Tepidanaerobacter acetatoxydans (strain DSM 21804 / JCM 16047 / Re1) TaxID=1209989 RepID=F4LXL1_TEPAE|nr:ABC transporter ATP-binding protein [Tepidanaerobacter acetatoxydans]AEE91940.1 Phosphonate-transporting ATPase [Tepidanaerobacter acetatoxydans Re1]CCP26767.1 leucine/isoleucine/valine transporter subunit; ATP-binding component of ABC superfamily [Tepidanaerobacter acetatoxydans Re1]